MLSSLSSPCAHQAHQGLGVLALLVEWIEVGAGVLRLSIKAIADRSQETRRAFFLDDVDHHALAVAIRIRAVGLDQPIGARVARSF